MEKLWYLEKAPSSVVFLLDLAGGKVVILIEPDSDNSLNSFFLKLLVVDIPVATINQTAYSMEQNLSFPTGTVSRYLVKIRFR